MPVYRLASRRAPSVPLVCGWLVQRGATVVPDMPEGSGPWPEGSFRAFIPNVSTRGVVIATEGGRFTVDVQTLACAEDHALGVGLAVEVAQEIGEALLVDGVACPAQDVAPDADAFAREVRALALRARSAVMTFPGPYREFHVGPRLVETIGADPSVWTEAMRAVQYPSDDVYVERRPSDRGAVTVVRVSEGEASMLPWAEYVELGSDEPLVLPFARASELLGPLARPLDERNMALEALSSGDFAALLRRARPYAVDDLDADAGGASRLPTPVGVEMADLRGEDISAGPPIVRTVPAGLASAPMAALTASPWALPLLGAMLFAVALAFGIIVVGLVAVLWGG